jgi:hypothetical protein
MMEQLQDKRFLIVHDHRGTFYMPIEQVRKCDTWQKPNAKDGHSYELQFLVKLDALKPWENRVSEIGFL